jgi:predicted alpha/beta-fold hydrolase
MRREVLPTPDGDTLVLDHLDGPSGTPRLLLVHGLEGSSYSVYIQGKLAIAARRGWRGTALNFRSCARDPNDLDRMLLNSRPRLYHSGETTDFDLVVTTLSSRENAVPLVAAGVSLGGNVLLKWLGENPGQSRVAAAAALTTPYDLAAGSRYLENWIGRFYCERFLKTLRPKAYDVARRFPEAGARMDLERVRKSRFFWDFDDAATGPLHGFAGAQDYYTRSSSLNFLDRITTPTLCLSAEDDAFLPPSVLPQARRRASASIDFRTIAHGGHIGFIGGTVPWRPVYWAEELAVAWLARQVTR